MNEVAEIKNRISIEQLVSQYVQLKKAGRQFKGLCPFHKERTPSFYVSPERQIAYCFGCRKGGDHFAFVQEIEGVDFKGALELLAEKAGVTLAPRKTGGQLGGSPESSYADERKSLRTRLFEIHEAATDFFTQQLAVVLSYLKKRGVTEDTMKRARLGFAPETGDLLYTHLLEKQFTRDEIISAGLALARDVDQGVCVDRFRNRLIFPITDTTGRVCAFGARALSDKENPKYLNSPETLIYEKRRVLFNLSNAKAEIKRKAAVIVVEGYMDALSVFQAGFENVVASSGTALTEEQLAILKRFTDRLIFAFDRDTAGSLATLRALELALAQDFVCTVALWDSDAKDPDECIRKDRALFEKSIEHPASVSQYLAQQFSKEGKDSPAEKKKIVSSIMPFLSATKSAVEKDAWISELASDLHIGVQALYDELKRFNQKSLGHRKTIVSQNTDSLMPSVGLDEYLVGLLLTEPRNGILINQYIRPEQFADNELENIYRSLTTQYNQPLEQQVQKRADILKLYVETKLPEVKPDDLVEELKITALRFLRNRLDIAKRELHTRIKEEKGSAAAELLDDFQTLLASEQALSLQWQKN